MNYRWSFAQKIAKHLINGICLFIINKFPWNLLLCLKYKPTSVLYISPVSYTHLLSCVSHRWWFIQTRTCDAIASVKSFDLPSVENLFILIALESLIPQIQHSSLHYYSSVYDTPNAIQILFKILFTITSTY